MSCWLVSASWKPAIPNGFASRRYNLTDDGNMRAPCVPNAINTLSEETHLSTTNSSNLCSSNIKVNLSKKKKKIQSQSNSRQKDKKMSSSNIAGQVIRCKGTKHNTITLHSFGFSSYILCYGFWVLVRWLFDGFLSTSSSFFFFFFFLPLFNTIFVLMISILNAFPCFVVT